MSYDSTKDTENHIKIVARLLFGMAEGLRARGTMHDKSKLESPEKEMYDEFVPLLKQTTYGSKEYEKALKEMGSALKHHYENNSHHPEHYKRGINGMNLGDIVEMFCDWLASTLKHDDGDFMESMKINKERFNMSDQLHDIFINTYLDIKRER